MLLMSGSCGLWVMFGTELLVCLIWFRMIKIQALIKPILFIGDMLEY
ncbi:unnamed protein product [Rhodiola kirilowii]